MYSKIRTFGLACNFLVLAAPALGSMISIGPNGINSAGLGLTGAGVHIGQVEMGRPGLPGFDPAGAVHTDVNPTAVFRQDGAPALADADGHALNVAGVMISEDAGALAGVAPDASLHASAYVTAGVSPGYEHALLTIQHVATRNGDEVRAVNHSWGKPLAAGGALDGDTLLTAGLDWSARVHDTLHVVAGNEGLGGIPVLTDNFNGITVTRSSRVGGVYRLVDPGDIFSEDAVGDRTSIDIMAPGEMIEMTGLGSMPVTDSGTSFAAPHVTGTVALLQEHAETQIAASVAGWGANARRHEVMKAVLMNSADKLIDDGTVMVDGNAVPRGGLLGMTRTVLKQNGMDTWLDSQAFGDSESGPGKDIPLDEEMGAGHLNARRALTQLQSGEQEPGATPTTVPLIGWDYGTTPGDNQFNRYRFNAPLIADSFISITLAWDRVVQFTPGGDGGTTGAYDIGDTFQPSASSFPDADNDDQINDLSIYLLPIDSVSIFSAVAQSTSSVGTLEHLFFQIPTTGTGQYEFWVRQAEDDAGVTQNYGVAWWAVSAFAPPVAGDFDGDGIVGQEDYELWAATFGSTTELAADGNDDGIINLADYIFWRDRLGETSASASFAAVPEPSTFGLLAIGFALMLGRRSTRFNLS